jgi:hypothetical protein
MIPLALIFSVLLSGIVYRCDADNGAIEFRDLPCPDGAGVEWAAPSAPAVRSTPSNRPANGLSDAEVRELAALQQRLAGDAADARRRRGVQQRRNASRAAERRKRCELAISRIGSLRVQKRRGYAAKDAPRLDAEQARLESIIDADC